MVELSKRDRMVLGYLRDASEPLFGAHLTRGETLSDPDMKRWLELGLIEVVGEGTGYVGYALTNAGKDALLSFA